MKKFNYAQSLAYLIIAANKLGQDFGYYDESIKIIQNKKILPVFLLHIEKTANEARNWIINNDLTEKAQEIIDGI